MSKKENSKLLDEIRKRRQEAQAHWQEIYDQGREDKDFVTLDDGQWDSAALVERKAQGKPSLQFNLLRTYCRQQINTQRQNRAQAMVLPVDGGADVDIAKILQGLIKDTEESSDFENVADLAAENAVYGGIGFYRIITDYVSPDSFQQEPRFMPVYNPEAVLIDPLSKALDGSDMSYAIVAEWLDRDTVIAQYGDDAVSDFEIDDHSEWTNDTDKTVCIAEYFYKDDVSDTLYLLQDGTSDYKSKLDDIDEDMIVQARDTTRTVIKWAKVSGCAVLEEGEFPSKWIPIIPVYGEVTWVGNKRHVHSLVHFAKDPQRLFNYWKSVEAHILQKNQDDILAVESESVAGFESEWQNPAKYGMSRYRSKSEDGQQLAPPQRIGAASPPMGVLNAAQGAQTIITDILNMHAPVMGGQGNETSGVAINMRQRQSETAQFHFQDNLNKGIRHGARILLDVYQAVYDTEVVRRIVGADGEVEFKALNAHPKDEQEAQKVGKTGLLNDLSIGRYDVRMDTGPAYNTQRDQNFAMMMQLMQFNPQLFGVVGDILLKDSPLMNAKEIAERVKLTIPEHIRNAGKEGEQQIPPELQQQMQQAEQTMQQMQQELQGAMQQLNDKSQARELEMLKIQLQAEKDIKVAQINASSRADVQELRGMVDLIKQNGTIAGAPDDWSQQGEDVGNYNPDMPMFDPNEQYQPEQQPFNPQSDDVPPEFAQSAELSPPSEGFLMPDDLAQQQQPAPEFGQFGNDAPMVNDEDLLQ